MLPRRRKYSGWRNCPPAICALRPLLTLSITEPLEKVRLKKQNACAANMNSRVKAAVFRSAALSPNRELRKALCSGH